MLDKSTTHNIRVILNGKKAGLPEVRAAIASARKRGTVEVRPTFEGGDVDRLVREAAAEKCVCVVAGGGDGTVNEVADAVSKLPEESRPEIAVLPLGTANDFGSACGVPTDDLDAALRLAQTGTARPVDLIRVNDDRCCVNIATGGFGAQVTANTPVELKNFLGGGAYTLSGVVQALGFTPYPGTVVTSDGSSASGDVIVSAVCNGRQAGGGQQLAPDALIDDGLMDVVCLLDFEVGDVPTVLEELMLDDPSSQSDKHRPDNKFLIRDRVTSITWKSGDEHNKLPCNLDGEPIEDQELKFEVIPGALRLVVPEGCPMLEENFD